MQPDVGNTPQFEAPLLAALARQITDRPYWAAEDKFFVDAETFERARAEMVMVQNRHGRPVAVADLKEPNFLLRGVPVVMAHV